MTKFKKQDFPKNMLGKMTVFSVIAPDGSTVDIEYRDLGLVVVQNQLCFLYESEDGDLIMPIARKKTIETLYSK